MSKRAICGHSCNIDPYKVDWKHTSLLSEYEDHMTVVSVRYNYFSLLRQTRWISVIVCGKMSVKHDLVGNCCFEFGCDEFEICPHKSNGGGRVDCFHITFG